MSRPTSSALLLLIAGCAPSINSATFRPEARTEPASDAPVRVYAEARPRCPVEEVGIVSGTWSNGLLPSSPDQVLQAMRERARKMGGDAIVGLTTSEVVDVQAVPAVGGTLPTHVLRGIVVRFADSSCIE